jgi:hypothetical protein
MKQRVTAEEVKKLTKAQKQRLKELWSPEKFDVALASICKDVINETYDYIEFVIGEMRVYNRMEDEILIVNKIERMSSKAGVTLQRLRLIDDKFYKDKVHLFTNAVGETNDDEIRDEDIIIDETEVEGDFTFEYEEPEDYFSLNDCLPLFNIGQMIEIINYLNTNQGGYSITIPDKDYDYSDGKYKVHNMLYDEHEHDELCDLLWEIIVELL